MMQLTTMTGIDQKDFEKIFNTWYEAIRNFLYYKTGDIRTAEDIAQDVFLKIWEKRDEVRQETIKPFLYTLANNLFLNRQEHAKVIMKFAAEYEAGVFSESPDYEMEMREFDQRLQETISNLDEKKRTVFLMNRIEKLTYNQIAENLGITVKAVEKRMEKALAYLKNRLEVKI
jgi:RNA polymerase sigma-70 factor (family 1)